MKTMTSNMDTTTMDATRTMKKGVNLGLAAAIAILSLCSGEAFAGPDTRRNMPKCDPKSEDCGCSCDEVSDGCIKVSLAIGNTTPWSGSMSCALKIMADDDSPSIFTAESLHAVLGGYTFKRLGTGNMDDGVTPSEVLFSHPNGESVRFVFKNGESWGRPDPGVHVKMDERLMMVDAEGWATTHDPVYYDLYVGDGTKRRFLATNMTGALGSLVSITDARGVTVTPAEMGIDIVYDSNGVRQFLTPSRLANVTHTADWKGYDVAVHAISEVPNKDIQSGLYAVPVGHPVEHLSIRRENDGKRAVVTLRKGGGVEQRYVFDYLFNDWSLTRPSGMMERKESYIDDERAAQVVKTDLSSSGSMLAKTVKNYKWESWGFAMTNRVDGFGGVTNVTEWTYYTSGNGKGQVKTEKRQSGLLTQYTYDSLDRVISETRSGPGMMTEVTTYDYTPVDASDPVLPVDTRPRTIVKTLNSIECERTYYVYSPLTNIIERVGTQGAPYGFTNALRTVTAFYPAVANDVRSGLVASIRHEDGKLDLCDYELSSNIWVRTVTHLHEQSPAPVSGKTTRDITATNRRGETVEQKTEAFIDGSWYTIARDRMTYNATGKRIRTENLAGQATVTDWDCCHKVSEVKPDGSTTTWDYDEEGRMVASSRLIPLDMTNVTWVTTCYSYDGLGRQTSTWTTNYTAHVGTPATTTSYDGLGRVISRTIPGRGTSLTRYSANGLVVTNIAPNGATSITCKNSNGDTLSITGTGVTPEFMSRGVLADGTRWTKTVQGETADSPRFTKRYENLLGQSVRSEKSGFRGAVLASVNTYDSYGRLVSSASEGEPTSEIAYDALGNRTATTTRVASGEWRKSESYSGYALRGSDIWAFQTNVVSCSDTTIPALTQSRASRVTGLTPAPVSQLLTTDARGNVSESRVEFDGFESVNIGINPAQTGRAESHSRLGVAVRSVSASGVESRVRYDGLGRQVAMVDGRGNEASVVYDNLGRRTCSVDVDGNRTTYGYDNYGHLVAVTNPMGEVVTYAYDLRGRKTYEGGATYPVRYTYDVFGNKVSMTTYRDESLAQTSDDGRARSPSAPSGDTTTWLYDEASNCMTNKVYADKNGTKYEYDAHGRLTKRTWARGIDTTYTYDAWGRLTRTDYSDSTPSVVLCYDAMGRQTRAVDAAGITTFAYDAFGSLTNETVVGVAGTNTIERFYDAFGRDAGYALNGVRQSTLGYDAATGRLVTMQAAGSDTPFTWSYLAGSDLKSSLAYPNGMTASWTYGNRGELLEVNNASPTGTISKYAYTYDAVGRRIACAKSGTAFEQSDSINYGYNARSELTSATTAVDSDYRYGYNFDDIGNRKTSSERGNEMSYSANQLNQYTSIDTTTVSPATCYLSPTYDDDGNQTLIKTATGIWSVTYNGENRPILWENVSPNSSTPNSFTPPLISMSYDRMGRRVTKNDQRFVYNGYLQIADNDGNTYIWDCTEPVATRPLVWKRGTSVAYYTHDGNKNVSEVIASNNDIAAHYEYAPFGALTVSRGVSAAINPFRFSSEYAEDDTATVYYNYRHYEPVTGRWMQRDPAGDVGILALHVFVKNSPITEVDVIGLACQSTVWGFYCFDEPDNGHDSDLSNLERDKARLLSMLLKTCPSGDEPIATSWASCCDRDSCQDQARMLVDLIYDAVLKNSEEVWAGGWIGNALWWFGKGLGCADWQAIVYGACMKYYAGVDHKKRCFDFQLGHKEYIDLFIIGLQHNWVVLFGARSGDGIDVDPWGSGGNGLF